MEKQGRGREKLNNGTEVRRINTRCAEAIEEIRVKIQEQIHIDLSFSECSEVLGEKYFRGQLSVIPYAEIRKKYGSKTGWPARGAKTAPPEANI